MSDFLKDLLLHSCLHPNQFKIDILKPNLCANSRFTDLKATAARMKEKWVIDAPTVSYAINTGAMI